LKKHGIQAQIKGVERDLQSAEKAKERDVDSIKKDYVTEKEGWVKRDKLLNFNGRRRTPQVQLAKDLGLLKYSTPAGGCLLTDPSFCRRLKELLVHKELNLDNLSLLKVGRHFRIGDSTRLVVGRDEGENNLLTQLAKPGDYLLGPQKDLAGPTALARGPITEELIFLSSEITSAYTDAVGLRKIEVFYRQVPAVEDNIQKVACVSKNRFTHLLI